MEQKQAAQLVQEQMKILFAFAFSKLGNREEAEDLCSEIMIQLLKSLGNLKDEEAFYGYMWGIARNVYKNYLRKQKYEFIELEDKYVGNSYMTPETSYLLKEDIQILRRELALLSTQYRQATIGYYMEGKSCIEIANEMQLSVDMVKYYLFKVRKILKEGIGMNRELGEKSYNPGVFRMDFWGDETESAWWDLFERKLPGNILLSAYYNPVSIRELSMELGVATPYLEDEMNTLIEYGMLSVLPNGRYQTNMIIFTDVYEQEVEKKVRVIYKELSQRVGEQIHKAKNLECFKALKQQVGNEERLLWAIMHIIASHVIHGCGDIGQAQFGDYPILANGKRGFLYGYDNNYENHHFHGIYGHIENAEGTGHIEVINYKVIEKYQQFVPRRWEEREAFVSIMLGKNHAEKVEQCMQLMEERIILKQDHQFVPNFPILTQAMFDALSSELEPIISDFKACTLQVIEEASHILKDHAPKNLKAQCQPLAFIKYKADVVAWVVETMVKKDYLKLPQEKTPLAILGILK